MTLESLALIAASLCLVIGSGFVIVGVIGILKFNDPMTRLHAPTKVGTIGIGMLLLASILVAAASKDLSIHELLIMAFLFATAPVSAQFIASQREHPKALQQLSSHQSSWPAGESQMHKHSNAQTHEHLSPSPKGGGSPYEIPAECQSCFQTSFNSAYAD